MILYTIYDKAAEKYSPPFACLTDLVAIRSFQKFSEGLGAQELEDFKLYRCGTFSDSTGLFTCFGGFDEINV